MRTKSIRLTEAEDDELRRYVSVTGEVEAAALKRAAMRGIREMRIEQGILAFMNGQGSSEAAEIAGLPRAIFLQTLIDKGVTMLQGPSTLAQELDDLGRVLGDERLTALAEQLSDAEERAG